MKKRTGILMSSLFVLGFSFLLVNNSNSSEQIVRDKNIIVELKDVNGTDVESRSEVEKAFKRQLQSVVGLNYRITSNIKGVSNILFIDVNSDDVDKIKELSLVENVKESSIYTMNYEDILSYDPYDSSVMPDQNYSTKTMNIDDNSKDGENTLVAILDDSFVIDHEVYSDLNGLSIRYSKTDIQKIINSGVISAKNPGYKNNKVPFYYSYGTSSTDLTYKNNSTYHGQHVAGIAGANSNRYKGISQNAQLALMKVTNSSGEFSSDTAILNALNDCSALDVDAINMSFGIALMDFDYVDDLYQSVFNKLYEKGIAINYAAGNDGRASYGYTTAENLLTSSSETSVLGGSLIDDKTTAIASIYNEDDDSIKSSISTIDGTSIRLKDQIVNHKYSDGLTIKTQKYKVQMPFYSLIPDGEDKVELEYVVVPNYGDTDDYKNIDVNGKIALIKRGAPKDANTDNYTFIAKIRNAVKNGAKGVIIYNNEDATNQVGYFALTSTNDKLEQLYYVPTGYLNSYDGNLLANQDVKKIVVSKELVSDFTSDGSTASLQLKPDIAAPGSDIYSSIGGTNYSYGYLSGTSMAAPNYTGAFVNILSNYDLSNEENRVSKRKELVARIMSTADLLKQSNGSYYSPRLVGAGKVDASGAYNSSVYLLGNNENKAKIELKNNDQIKNGEVSFKVKTVNESTTSKKYSVKLTIQAPEITGGDASFGAKLENAKYQTSKDVLLKEVSLGEIIVGPGESSFDVNAKISEENKKYLDNNFENGTYLEGYVELISLDDDEDLSIPYMGYYGDYDSEDPVEPFNFEKDDNKVYGSDLLNKYLNSSLENADYSSMWVTLEEDLTSSDYANIMANKASFLNYGSEVLYDSDNKEVILNQNSKKGKFVIQQFVNRSVKENKVTMINKQTNENVLAPINDKNHVDHMFSLCSSDGSDDGKLYKSYLTTSFISNGYYADRAYSYFDFSSKEQFPNGVTDGLYEFRFEYTLVDGTVITKSYNLRVGDFNYDEKASIESQTIKEIDGEKYFVLRTSAAATVKLNDVVYDQTKDDSGYYAKAKISEFENEGKIFTEVIDKYGAKKTALMSLDDNYVSIIKDGLVKTDSIKCSITTYSSLQSKYIYEFYFENSNGSISKITGDAIIAFALMEGKSTDELTIYTSDSFGFEKEISYEIVDGRVVFKTSSSQVIVSYSGTKSIQTNASSILIVIMCAVFGGLVIAAIIIILLNRMFHKRR